MKLLLIEPDNNNIQTSAQITHLIDAVANSNHLSSSRIAIQHTQNHQIASQVSASRHCLCLFDYYTAYNQFKLIEHISKNKQCFTAIYHAPVQISMSDLRQLGRLAGYFYSDTPSRTIAQAVSNIAIGQRSLPPAISDQLLDYYQSAVVYYDVSYCTNLTRREIEVLKHLKQGGSNTKLADALFISEHTIKSHLYQIFKKIEVQSRSQAIAWAHKYLL